MKRSDINKSICWAKNLLDKNNIHLPDMADWKIADWKKHASELDVVRSVMLGWDVTDFGTDDFANIGGVLYTVRNGSIIDASIGVPYCEKYIIMKEGQHLPKHYHVWKTEDIINRAGGVLQVFLWNVDKDGLQLDTEVHVRMDGIERVFNPGEAIEVYPGNSISLTPYMAHIFGPMPGKGDLIAGEVSKVNDDTTDNYFLEPIHRFSEITEDEPMIYPLCNEYDKILL